MGCCKYHNSVYTYGAILLSVITWFLSIGSLSKTAIVAGLFAMLFVMCAMCCRLHRYFLFFTMLLSLVSMIGCFVGATKDPEEVCDRNGICSDVNPKPFGVISGLLWLAVTAMIYKIPLTDPNADRDNEMVGMHASGSGGGGGGGGGGGQHDIA